MNVHCLSGLTLFLGMLLLAAGPLEASILSLPIHHRGLPDGEMNDTVELRPLLLMLFFDSASASIPPRYHTFADPWQTEGFSDSTISGEVLDQYRYLLDIIGYRMRRSPETKIRITGCNSRQPGMGETIAIAEARGRTVQEYLMNIWGIDFSRIRVMAPRDLPEDASDNGTSLGIGENRRAEIESDDWEVSAPDGEVSVHRRGEYDDELRISVAYAADSHRLQREQAGAAQRSSTAGVCVQRSLLRRCHHDSDPSSSDRSGEAEPEGRS